MYHVIGVPPPGASYPELWVSPEQFLAEMEWLRAHGYHAVTLDQVDAYWREGTPLPARPIVLTFDDGYRGDYAFAAPVLERLHWPGVLNLELRHLNVVWGLWKRQVRELVARGWEIDSHTITHPDLTTLSPAELRHEVAGSRAELRAMFGVPVDFFCYPAGRYDAAVIAAVRAAGYRGATTEREGLARRSERFTLARIRVNGSAGVAGLAAELNAAGA
jgi:peptidoglycan/xylan/chitin deacetylase (PgdA/CDA1 family)